MSDIDPEKRVAGLEFANKLSLIAAEAPDLQTEYQVHELAKRITRRFTYSRDLRKKEIVTHLKKHTFAGGMSIAELIDATGYHKDVVYDLSKELELGGLVEFRSIRPAGAGAGRPAVRLFAVLANFSAQKS